MSRRALTPAHRKYKITTSGYAECEVQVADEIINLLASDPTAALKITVEINAEFPEEASDQLKQAVSENAVSLEFGTSEWE